MNKKLVIRSATREITLKEFMNGWRNCKRYPQAVFKHGLTGFLPKTGTEIRREYLEKLHERINERGRI